MHVLCFWLLLLLPYVASQRFLNSNHDDSFENNRFQQDDNDSNEGQLRTSFRAINVNDDDSRENSGNFGGRVRDDFSSQSDETQGFATQVTHNFSPHIRMPLPAPIFSQQNTRSHATGSNMFSFGTNNFETQAFKPVQTYTPLRNSHIEPQRNRFSQPFSNSFSRGNNNQQGTIYVPPVSPSSSRYASHCGNGEVLDLDGRCSIPEIIQNIYIYGEPASIEDETSSNDYYFRAPKPKVKYNLVVIKSNDDDSEEDDPIIVPPALEKTVVLVLDREEEDKPKRVIHVPDNPSIQPEVYFVDYKDGENPLLPGGIDLQTALTATNTGKRISISQPSVPHFESSRETPRQQQYNPPQNQQTQYVAPAINEQYSGPSPPSQLYSVPIAEKQPVQNYQNQNSNNFGGQSSEENHFNAPDPSVSQIIYNTPQRVNQKNSGHDSNRHSQRIAGQVRTSGTAPAYHNQELQKPQQDYLPPHQNSKKY